MQSDIGRLLIPFHLITADTRRSQIGRLCRALGMVRYLARSTQFASLRTCYIDQQGVPGLEEGPTMSCYGTTRPCNSDRNGLRRRLWTEAYDSSTRLSNFQFSSTPLQMPDPLSGSRERLSLVADLITLALRARRAPESAHLVWGLLH
jgi:hypothetical protein